MKYSSLLQQDQETRTSPCVVGSVGWAYVAPGERGVIALKDAKAGEVLECSPVIPAKAEDYEAKHGDEIYLDNYLLLWEEKGEGVEYAVGMGFLMLYNHDSDPNTKFVYNYPGREISVVAQRDIKAGEELCIDYEEPWFEPRKR